MRARQTQDGTTCALTRRWHLSQKGPCGQFVLNNGLQATSAYATGRFSDCGLRHRVQSSMPWDGTTRTVPNEACFADCGGHATSTTSEVHSLRPQRFIAQTRI